MTGYYNISQCYFKPQIPFLWLCLATCRADILARLPNNYEWSPYIKNKNPRDPLQMCVAHHPTHPEG